MLAEIVACRVLSLFATLIQIPLIFWHGKNKNVGNLCLIVWMVILNLTTFVNSFVWQSDDITSWWSGHGYCDILVRFDAAANVGVLCAVAAIARNLYIMISDKGLTYNADTFQVRATDLAICLVFPTLIFAIIVVSMSDRYFLVQYRGCTLPLSNQWPSILTLIIWGPIWAGAVMYYTILSLVLYVRKRAELKDLLQYSNTGISNAQFIRLLVFCSVIAVVLLPITVYNAVLNGQQTWIRPYNWDLDHNWADVIRVPATAVSMDLWVYIAVGIVEFLIIGTGAELLAIYKRRLGILWLSRKLKEAKDKGASRGDRRGAGRSPRPPALMYSPGQSSFGSTVTPTKSTAGYSNRDLSPKELEDFSVSVKIHPDDEPDRYNAIYLSMEREV